MADQRISQLTELGQNALAANDLLPIVDSSSSETKKITAKSLFQGAAALADNSTIDLATLNQSSATKLGTVAIADDAITAAKLANDSSVNYGPTEPAADNFEGRGHVNSTTKYLKVYDGSVYQQVIAPTAGIEDLSVNTSKLAANAVTTAKIDASGLAAAAIATDAVTTAKIQALAVTEAKIATGAVSATKLAADAVTTAKIVDDAVTYAKIQNVTATNKLLGRATAGAGDIEEITLTAAGRALLDDADAATQRTTLGLGTLATQSGTFSGTFSGTSSNTNTGDQTITLTGDVTGTGTGSFAATIATDAVTTAKIINNAVTTAKINDDAITAAKIADAATTVIAAVSPNVNGVFTGQQWFNTVTKLPYVWNGSAWQQSAGIVDSFIFADTTPLTFSAAVGSTGVVTITSGLETQTAATILSGPTTGSAATPTFRTLVATDLPVAGASTNGAVQPGTGLTVTGAGVLNHTNSATAGTYTKVTIDAQGHVNAGTTLSAADIPVLDTSKITTGIFAANLIGTSTITGEKLANSSTIKFGGSGSTSGVVEFPTADFQGQLFWDELNSDLYIWNGSAWLSVTVTSGELVFAGIYNASTNVMTSISAAGAGLGLTVGGVLPASSETNKQYYVVVGTVGTGTAPAPAVALQPPDFLISTGTSWTLVDVSTTVAAANNATGIVFTPAGDIVATNVQSAIVELDNEKLAKAGGTITGNLEIGTAGSLTFEGSSADANETTIAVVNPTADRTITFPDVTGTVITTGDTGSVTSAMLLDGTVVNADINASAAIAYSKLATLTSANILVGSSSNVATSTAVTGDITISNTGVTSIATGVIVNADIDTSAAIAYSKLATLTSGNIVVGNASNTAASVAVTGDIAISSTGLTSIAAGVILDADINASAAIVDTKLAQITTAGKVANSATTATNANTPSAIVTRDASGNFSAGTITAALTGTASLATSAATCTGNAATVTTNANLTGDITSVGNATAIAAGVIVDADINASAGIADTKLATIATAGKVANTATTATVGNAGLTIVARDVTGSFSAGTITANLAGNASTVTTNANLTGDITSTGNATAIAAGVIVDADINASAGIVDTKLAQITTAGKVSGTAITTGNISTTGSITTTSTLSVQSLTFGRGGGANVNNTAAGANALVSNSGGVDNTAMGNAALQSNISGTGNTGIGLQSLYTNTTANFNTALGLGALFTNNAANNTAVGVGALKFNSSGANNTAIGAIALENNTTGSNNVGIGYSVASSSTTVSNEVNISNGTVNARYQGAASAWTFLSDVRDKTDIENLALGLDFITALKPRKFKWNLRNTEVDRGKPSAGFIAQEVLQTVEAFGASYTNLIDTNDPNQYTFAQANMIPILVKAVQELSAMVKQLQSAG